MFGIASQSYRVGMRPAGIGTALIASPNSISGIQGWYNADLGTSASGNFNQNLLSGDDIGQWKDRSGLGHNLNQSGNATVKPNWYSNQAGIGSTLGAVRFNGTSESLDINPVPWLQSLGGCSVFIVARPTTVGVTTRTICSTNAGEFKISNSTNWRVATANCTGVSTITGVGDTTKFNIIGLVFDGAGIGNSGRLRFRYNKIERTLSYTGTASTITSASGTDFFVGVGSGTDFFTGDIAELVLYNKALSKNEIYQIENYLGTHWNI